LDHYNLPVVAGDCLLALPIILRPSAAMHADLNPVFTEAAGKMFSVIVNPRSGFFYQVKLLLQCNR
jgi:hypothetical protein